MAQPASPTGSSTETAASFGKVAIRLGFITPSQLEEAVKVQTTAAKAGLRKRLGEILIKKGYLTPEQFQQVIRSQTVKNKRIGPYELISKLGEGGMGSVFKARQIFMDRIIALKILSPKVAKNKAFQARFVREARAVAKLNHPNIVAGIDVGSADGYCYFAMEFVDGESLGHYMARKGGKLPEERVLEYGRQAALALHHAHQNNLLHRDVKPDNLLLDAEHRTVKLADLGLARSAESAADDAALTQAGQAVGTPFYISPEQARGSTDITPATDVYSLGASLFHMLTGQVPFDGATAAVIMTRHLTDPAPSLCKLNPAISANAEKIVLKCMEKRPEDRYESAAAVAADIEKVQTGAADLDIKPKSKPSPGPGALSEEKSVSAGAPSPVSQTRVFRRRKRGNDAALVALVLCFVLIAALAVRILLHKDRTVFTPPPPPPKQQAEPASLPPLAPVTVQIPAVPAQFPHDRESGFTFKLDFEDETNCCDADPLLMPLETVSRVRDGNETSKNHVLLLARIKDEAACMARVLLPNDLELSPNATVQFQVCFTKAGETPELQIAWDHRVRDGAQRFLSKWTVRMANLRTWEKVEIRLENAQTRMQSRQLPEKPQFLSVMAGKPGEDVNAYIDNIVISDQGRSAPGAPTAPVRGQPAAPQRQDPPRKDPPSDPGGDALRRAL